MSTQDLEIKVTTLNFQGTIPSNLYLYIGPYILNDMLYAMIYTLYCKQTKYKLVDYMLETEVKQLNV